MEATNAASTVGSSQPSLCCSTTLVRTQRASTPVRTPGASFVTMLDACAIDGADAMTTAAATAPRRGRRHTGATAYRPTEGDGEPDAAR